MIRNKEIIYLDKLLDVHLKIKRAERNLSQQRRRWIDNINSRVRPQFWYHVIYDYQRELKSIKL